MVTGSSRRSSRSSSPSSPVAVSGVVTLVIALALKATMGWRITGDDELSGIDMAEHAESAYDLIDRGGRLGSTGILAGLTRTEEPAVKEGASA